MIQILVTGGNGQLAQCLKSLSENYKNYQFTFFSREDFNIVNEEEVKRVLKSKNFSFCINCAAFTNVDNCELNNEAPDLVNNKGVKYLATACKENNVKLVHVSTDFVFDGNQSIPYKETDKTNPLGVYGTTKLLGEEAVQNTCDAFYILRTSWLYSEFGNNFLKTMLRLSETRPELGVVFDQVGTPTYAKDLASIILTIIKEDNDAFGIYHYSNEGVASWYDFAIAIFSLKNINTKVLPIRSEQYPTPATRPSYSVFDKQKIKDVFNVTLPHWRTSLEACLQNV
ncbi:dTDP-4-dehydrorhamnose reductase [Neotamlana laminarinivorans]|uniref:dTDP-4-dehydrorhamnose reductase n=1 Tax=Neotamlana laminarinivorans TaxID=2883124 RepID=A0A9X1L399_9FLAO|nr:dTDP-4-dehydrorhamnose reductase [Tamlana laminarinivorans]MCB4798314.1 dTDP-4-dehydrorhamnose reductase [Tamlana laminarinivorans]